MGSEVIYAVFDQEGECVVKEGEKIFNTAKEAREVAEEMAIENPGMPFHVLATIDICTLPTSSVKWESKKN